AEQSQGLVDHVLLVLFGHLDLIHPKQLDHPARIKIHHETDASTVLGEMFDGESQSPGTGRAYREPVRTRWESLIREGCAKGLIVDPKVVNINSRFRNSCASACFEDRDGPI